MKLLVAGSGLAILAAAASIAGAGILFRASVRLTNPPGYAQGLEDPLPGSPADPSSLGLRFENVEFRAADGSALRGWYVPGTTSLGLVAAYGRASNRRDFLPELPMLHKLGLNVLLFDYRENGGSDGNGRGMSLGYRESQDIVSAVGFLKSDRALRQVGVIGHSLGGTAAILAAAEDERIDAVIAMSPIASFDSYIYDSGEATIATNRLLRTLPLPSRPSWWPAVLIWVTQQRLSIPPIVSADSVVDRIAPRPLLLIHGTEDAAVKPDHSRRLYARAGQPKELWLAEGATHEHVFSTLPGEFEQRVSDFLGRSLAP